MPGPDVLQQIWDWYVSDQAREALITCYHGRMGAEDNSRDQLKKLRDTLAFEAPRARTFSTAPAELQKRLQQTADLVSKVYLLTSPASSDKPADLEEVCADALVEGHLALHDWQEWIALQKQKPRTTGPMNVATAERRTSERQPTGVTVRLLRHSVRGEGPALMLSTEAASRPARNVSLGGIFVSAAPADLPAVGIGCVLHVEVSASADATPTRARAAVIRRDDTGMAMKWILDTAADQTAIEFLLAAIRRARGA